MRAMLGVDGNCGFALLGEDIQSGEAEFVEIEDDGDNLASYNERLAAHRAFRRLKERLGKPNLLCWFGPSHPFGN